MFAAKNATIQIGGAKLTGLAVKSVSVNEAADIVDEPIGFTGDFNSVSGTITVSFRFPKIRKTKGKQARLVRVWHG